MTSRTRVPVLLVLFLGFVAAPLRAQEPNHMYDRFEVGVSAAAVLISSTLRLDAESNGNELGTDVDAEDDLGLSKAGLRARFAFGWRPGRRHQISANYIPITRSGSKVLEEDIVIDSITYSAGAQLDTRLRSDQLGVTWQWAFHAAERTKAGLSVGLGATFFRPRLTGIGTVSDGGQTLTDTLTFQRSLTGPSFSIGGFGEFRVGRQWYVDADLRGLYVPISNITVTILDLGGAVRYYPLDWLGIEGGYSLSQQTVEAEARTSGGVDIGFTGRVRYLTQNIRLGLLGVF